MDKNSSSFTPEQVDEQLTQLSTPSSQVSQETTPAQRLVRELQAVYGAEEETTQAVAHVWQRLEKKYGNRVYRAPSTHVTPTNTSFGKGNKRDLSMKQHPQRKRWQIVGALVAALLLVAIAGGLVSLAIQYRTSTASINPNTTATQQPTIQATPAPDLYVTASTMVYKLDPATGKIKWHYQVGTDRNKANITYTTIFLHNTVYFADQSSALYAVDATSGQLKWKLPASANDILEHPITDGSTLYIYSYSRGFCSVDTQIGKLLRCYANLNPTFIQQGIFYGLSPASNAFAKTSIYAFDPAQNKTLWEKAIPLKGQGFQQMTYADGKLYVTSETTYNKAHVPALSSYIYAYDTQSGALLWKSAKVASDVILRPPAVANGEVYFGSQDGRFGALNANNGQALWSTLASNGSVYPTPATADGTVYIGVTDNRAMPISRDNNYIVALNAAKGTQIWKHVLHSFTGSQLLLDKGIIYVGGGDNKIYALNAKNGSAIWQTPLEGSLMGFSSGPNNLLLA